jgi:hypothetical protein
MTRAAEVSALLAARINQLCAELLPAGRREGHEWRCGSLAGEPGHSLGVHLTGPKAGIWCDFSTGQKGDALNLMAAVLGLDMADAITWGLRWLGRAETHATLLARARPPAADRHNDQAAANQTRALTIWRDAAEDIAGTPAEAYLRSRGLDPGRLYSLHGDGRWPATLRFSERSAFDPTIECRALIIAVHGADYGLVRAIQRILIKADGNAVRDERGRRRKLSLGPVRSNAAMFDYWPDPEGRWGLAEGPENALAACALTGIPTWAAISAGNMPHIAPPSWARHVTIFADHDPVGLATAAETRSRLRLHRMIETVRIVGAKTRGGDAADLLAADGHVA